MVQPSVLVVIRTSQCAGPKSIRDAAVTACTLAAATVALALCSTVLGTLVLLAELLKFAEMLRLDI